MTGNEIYNLLTREIREGRLRGRLPSIARMTAMYGTSHSTVQLVLDKLKMQGLVHGQKGRGIFVNETSLAQKNRRSVVILMQLQNFLRNSFYIKMLVTLKECLDRKGYELTLVSELTENLSRYSAALVTNANLLSEEELNTLKYALPGRICLLNHKLKGFVSVSNNNFQGGYLAAERLYQAGHRKVGFVTCYLDLPYSFFYDRAEGFRTFAKKHPDFRIMEFPLSGEENSSEISVIGREIIGNHPEISGIFTFKDIYASELQQLFRHAGRQVSLIGYGNSPYGSFLTPALTSIEEDAEGLGEAVCRTISQLAAGEKAESIEVPVKLIERDSVFTWQEQEKEKTVKRRRNN
ncbi:MAG: substrate-binding domain-containing protein [Lentisphaeria bacterium]|nr:substrate-binding domain-containing protein [Lentisphaeria bacterium]